MHVNYRRKKAKRHNPRHYSGTWSHKPRVPRDILRSYWGAVRVAELQFATRGRWEDELPGRHRHRLLWDMS
jgi:hypothetical protein